MSMSSLFTKFIEIVAKYKPGDSLALIVERNGKEMPIGVECIVGFQLDSLMELATSMGADGNARGCQKIGIKQFVTGASQMKTFCSCSSGADIWSGAIVPTILSFCIK